MVAYESILETYDAMSAKSGQMVVAAQQGDWDRLAVLEKDCSALVGALRAVHVDVGDTLPRPDAAYAKRKVALIRKVLADDAEIRRHTQPWMTRLQAYLGGARHDLRLQRTCDGGCAA